MPIDASIYSQQQPVQGFNTPFQALAQLGTLQRVQQQIQEGKALEQERQQKIAAVQRSQQSDQLLGQLFQQHTKINQDTGQTETDHQAIYNELMKVDPPKAEAYLAVADKAQERFNAFQADHMKMAKAALDLQNGLGQIIKDTPEALRPGAWSVNRVAMGMINPGILQQVPEQYPGDEALDGLISKGQSYSEILANKLKQAETAQKEAEAKKALQPTSPTEASLDAAQQALLTKKQLGQPLTAEEQASMNAYEQRKRTVSDPALLASNARAATAQEQANQRELDRQTFAKQQAGRAELTNKIEQPYQDAREKAETLRSVIDAAKGGNMQAANVQSLLGTLGLVTSEGVKRINTTELQSVAGAGSLLERIKGQASGLVAGKPLSEKLQGDLRDLAGIIEQSARKKYEQGFNSVKTRYGLDEEMIPDPNVVQFIRDPQTGKLVPK